MTAPFRHVSTAIERDAGLMLQDLRKLKELLEK
jgi:hypothetical protein